eukprot:1029391-Pyramimonas_sp.AAC.1
MQIKGTCIMKGPPASTGINWKIVSTYEPTKRMLTNSPAPDPCKPPTICLLYSLLAHSRMWVNVSQVSCFMYLPECYDAGTTQVAVREYF